MMRIVNNSADRFALIVLARSCPFVVHVEVLMMTHTVGGVRKER